MRKYNLPKPRFKAGDEIYSAGFNWGAKVVKVRRTLSNNKPYQAYTLVSGECYDSLSVEFVDSNFELTEASLARKIIESYNQE